MMAGKSLKPPSDSCKSLFTLMISSGSDELLDELLAQDESAGGNGERQKAGDFEPIACH